MSQREIHFSRKTRLQSAQNARSGTIYSTTPRSLNDFVYRLDNGKNVTLTNSVARATRTAVTDESSQTIARLPYNV